MKRLILFTALVIAATVAPCAADTIGLFRAVVPAGVSQFENQVLWVIFAPQPEPPRVANDGRTIQVLLPDAGSSLEVWVLVEGATGWHLNGAARMGVEPSPFHLNVGQRLTDAAAALAGTGVLGANAFLNLGIGLPATIALPPGAPAGTWIGGRFSVGPVGCPEPPPGTYVADCRVDPKEVELWVDTGVEEGWVPSNSVDGVDPGDGTQEGTVPVTAVPEPATLLLLGAGLVGLGARLRRRG